MKKLNEILNRLNEAAADIVLPPPPTGPFIFDIAHCCLRNSAGQYHNCLDYKIGGDGYPTKNDAAIACSRHALPQYGITATLEDGPCANSTCKPAVKPTTPGPKPGPKPCDPSRAAWDDCLNTVKVTDENRGCIVSLKNLVNAWLLNRCSLVDNLCSSVGGGSSNPGGPSGPDIMQRRCKSCQCQVWRKYEADLKALVEQFCAGNTRCKDILDKRDAICADRKKGIIMCRQTNGAGCNQIIPDTSDTGTCGM
jgi:hypothetical protein